MTFLTFPKELTEKLKKKVQHLRNQLNKTCYIWKAFLRIRLNFTNALGIRLVGVTHKRNLQSIVMRAKGMN